MFSKVGGSETYIKGDDHIGRVAYRTGFNPSAHYVLVKSKEGLSMTQSKNTGLKL